MKETIQMKNNKSIFCILSPAFGENEQNPAADTITKSVNKEKLKNISASLYYFQSEIFYAEKYRVNKNLIRACQRVCEF